MFLKDTIYQNENMINETFDRLTEEINSHEEISQLWNLCQAKNEENTKAIQLKF